MDRGPIFIGGLDRSGKTWLRLPLSSHPHLAFSRRVNLWTLFYDQYGDLSRRDNFERCLAAMLRHTHVRSLQPDAERLRQEFWQGEPTYARLFALLHEQYAQRQGKPRWGNQAELLERHADLLFAAYPTAKMIHLIRDPRDRYAATLTRRRRGQVGAATARWLYSVRLAERNRRRYPDRYQIVRYETLVSQPEATLREVCAFLDEAYTPAMLAMQDVPRFRNRLERDDEADEMPSPISTAYLGRFRQAIPKREIAFIQTLAGREMNAWGYTLEPIAFSPGEWFLFYLADWPANLARLMAWRVTEVIRHNRPALFGRQALPDTAAHAK